MGASRGFRAHVFHGACKSCSRFRGLAHASQPDGAEGWRDRRVERAAVGRRRLLCRVAAAFTRVAA